MSKYRMEDETIADTSKAVEYWNEATAWDGRNQISVNTGDQWLHETLFQSSKGRFYVVHSSDWQGSQNRAEWISPEEAVAWLELNNRDVPDHLKHLLEEIAE